MVPRRAEEDSKTIPDRKLNDKPHQDDHMTGLSSQGTGYPQFGVTLWGAFGRPKAIKKEAESHPKSKRKSRVENKLSKTIKDPSWSGLGRFGRVLWEPQTPKSIGKHIIS